MAGHVMPHGRDRPIALEQTHRRIETDVVRQLPGKVEKFAIHYRSGLSREPPNTIVIKLLGAKISVTTPHIMFFMFLAVFLVALVGYGILRLIPAAD